jgi:hypothetical protein
MAAPSLKAGREHLEADWFLEDGWMGGWEICEGHAGAIQSIILHLRRLLVWATLREAIVRDLEIFPLPLNRAFLRAPTANAV